MTQLESAVEFIHRAKWSDLNGVTEEEFTSWGIKSTKVVEDMIDFSDSHQPPLVYTQDNVKAKFKPQHTALENFQQTMGDILERDFDSLTIGELRLLH